MRDAEVEQNRRQLWRELERGFVSGYGLIVSAESRQHDAQIGLGLQVVRLDRERGAIFGGGFVELALLLKLDGAVEFHGGVLSLLKRDQRRKNECQNGLTHRPILHCPIAERQKTLVVEGYKVK